MLYWDLRHGRNYPVVSPVPINPRVHGLHRQLLRLKCDATEENMELEMPRPGDPSDDPSDDEGALKQGPASDRGIVAPPPPPFEGGADLNTERAEGLADHEADVMGGGSASMPEGSSAKRQRMDKDTKEEPASIVCEQHQSDVKQSRYD